MKFLLSILLCLPLVFGSANAKNIGLNANTPVEDSNEDNEVRENPLVETLCTIIIFLQGRLARALAAAAIFAFGIFFFVNQVSWGKMVVIVLGMALLFGARNIALAILPNYVIVKQNQGEDDLLSQVGRQTPDQVLRYSCPELT